MHLISLHDSSGSSNPLGTSGNFDRMTFAPYYTFKDLITIFLFFLVLGMYVYWMPNVLGDSENYIIMLLLYITIFIFVFKLFVRYTFFLLKILVLVNNSTISLLYWCLSRINLILPVLNIIHILFFNLNLLDSLVLFLSITESDWSFDQHSLGLDYDSDNNSIYKLNSSWLDIVLNKPEGGGPNNNGGSPNNNWGGPNNNGGGGPNNNVGGSLNNNGGSSQTGTVIDPTLLADYLEQNKMPGRQLRDIGITFNDKRLYIDGVNQEMSKIAIAIRKVDPNHTVFRLNNPNKAAITDTLINKVRDFQIPPS